MASALMSSMAARPCLAGLTLQRQQRSCSARHSLLVVAAEQEEGEQQRPRLSFKPSERAAKGYLEEDSAGQTNIFAVEPRQYLQGSKQDNSDVNPTANIIAASVGSIALALILSGLYTNVINDAVPISDEPGRYLTLTQYAQQFDKGVAAAPQLTDSSTA